MTGRWLQLVRTVIAEEGITAEQHPKTSFVLGILAGLAQTYDDDGEYSVEAEWSAIQRFCGQPQFANHMADVLVDLVKEHIGHSGGWYESPEGLRCGADDELVIPNPDWLAE